MEPKGDNLLGKRFLRKNSGFVDKLMVFRMFLMAIPMAIGTLYLFGQNYEANLEKAWTISLTTLAVFQWFNAWNCRSQSKSIFTSNPFSNKFLAAATGIVIGLQLLAVYNPFFQKLLRTVPLGAKDWLVIVAVASSIILVEELRKLIRNKLFR
jgi:Ca2+-transporting ATPase